jgi:uncharacterized protein (TIGR03067 family)
MLFVILAAICSVPGLVSAGGQAVHDEKALTGPWQLLPPAGPGGWTFKDGIVELNDINGGIRFSFKLDPQQSPKQIALIPVDNNVPLPTLQGIYQLEKDQLKVCVREAKHGRPKEFKTDPESGAHLLTLKRVNP